jgi:hypothetical protein
MSKTIITMLSAAALAASASMAFAGDMQSDQSMQRASNVQPWKATCHHDGELVQTPNGLAICHMRPVGGVHYMSRDWFARIGARAAGSNE